MAHKRSASEQVKSGFLIACRLIFGFAVMCLTASGWSLVLSEAPLRLPNRRGSGMSCGSFNHFVRHCSSLEWIRCWIFLSAWCCPCFQFFLERSRLQLSSATHIKARVRHDRDLWRSCDRALVEICSEEPSKGKVICDRSSCAYDFRPRLLYVFCISKSLHRPNCRFSSSYNSFDN